MTENELLHTAIKMKKSFAEQAGKIGSTLDLDFEDLSDYKWINHEDQIWYNMENCKEDLMNGSGSTHSCEIRYEIYKDDEFVIFEVDNGCGDRYSVLLTVANQMESSDVYS